MMKRTQTFWLVFGGLLTICLLALLLTPRTVQARGGFTLTQAEIDIIKAEYTADAATGAARNLPERPWADAQANDRIGYAALLQAGNDAAVAGLLNQTRPKAQVSIPRPDVAPLEILEAIQVGQFVASPNALAVGWFESLTQYPSVRLLNADGSDTRVMTNFLAILANGSSSETRLRALASRGGSIAEKLLGAGREVTAEEVGSTR